MSRLELVFLQNLLSHCTVRTGGFQKHHHFVALNFRLDKLLRHFKFLGKLTRRWGVPCFFPFFSFQINFFNAEEETWSLCFQQSLVKSIIPSHALLLKETAHRLGTNRTATRVKPLGKWLLVIWHKSKHYCRPVDNRQVEPVQKYLKPALCLTGSRGRLRWSL